MLMTLDEMVVNAAFAHVFAAFDAMDIDIVEAPPAVVPVAGPVPEDNVMGDYSGPFAVRKYGAPETF